jgi:hypothetical protein
MKLKKFINLYKSHESTIGDLVDDILSDPDIPDTDNEIEFFNYLLLKTLGNPSQDAFKEFKEAYYSQRNKLTDYELFFLKYLLTTQLNIDETKNKLNFYKSGVLKKRIKLIKKILPKIEKL